jgi:hypothetical protein
MKKTLVVSAFLASTLFAANQALADKPKLTPEEFAKAEKLASQIKPPVDLKALLDEVDRLGVKCEKFNLKAYIKNCSNKVEIAQSKERQAILDEEIKASRERQAKLDEDTRKKINDLADKADQKLKQIK